MPVVRLKKGRENKIRAFYPWVQKEEVTSADASQPGSIGKLLDHEGNFLATGMYNPDSKLPFRVLSLEDERIDQQFFVKRFEACKKSRTHTRSQGVRLVFAEADRLPGLIVDDFAGVLVVQVRNAGMDRLKAVWLAALIEVFEPIAVYERSQMEGRREEGLEPAAGILYGELPAVVEIIENGITYRVPVVEGLKTGFYLDQRDARRRLFERVQPGQTVLDSFCYSGGFALSAAKAGATATAVDLANIAVETAKKNSEINQLPIEVIKANVFDWLEETDRKFDWIILDPPAMGKSQDKREALKWSVWKLTNRAIDRLNDDGRMVICSCSFQLNLATLLDTIRIAAADKGKIAILEEITSQSTDHPVSLAFPESWYLKSAWVRFECG